METNAGVVYNNDDKKQYVEDKHGFKVHSAYIGQVKGKLGIQEHENYNDSHTSPPKVLRMPSGKGNGDNGCIEAFRVYLIKLFQITKDGTIIGAVLCSP